MDEKIKELEDLIDGQRNHLDKCVSENTEEQNERHAYIILGVMSYVNGMERALSIAKGQIPQTIEEAIEERQLKMEKDKEDHPKYYEMICNPHRVVVYHDNQYISGLKKAKTILV